MTYASMPGVQQRIGDRLDRPDRYRWLIDGLEVLATKKLGASSASPARRCRHSRDRCDGLSLHDRKQACGTGMPLHGYMAFFARPRFHTRRPTNIIGDGQGNRFSTVTSFHCASHNQRGTAGRPGCPRRPQRDSRVSCPLITGDRLLLPPHTAMSLLPADRGVGQADRRHEFPQPTCRRARRMAARQRGKRRE